MTMTTTDNDDRARRLDEGYLPVLRRDIAGDLLTPVSAYLALRGDGRESFLLESVEGPGHRARYSFIGLDPSVIVASRGGSVTLGGNGAATAAGRDLFDAARRLAGGRRIHPGDGDAMIAGSLAGFIGYDEVRSIELIPENAPDLVGAPDSLLGRFDTAVVFDHLARRVRIVGIADPGAGDGTHAVHRASERLAEIRSILRGVPGRRGRRAGFEAGRIVDDAGSFAGMVRQAIERIREGEIFQVVLSRPATVDYSGDPFQVYRALRMINPSPYHFYFDFGGCVLLGSSPELLGRLARGLLEHVPIAGTRPRGRDDAEDERIERQLLRDPKERAEHTMLVDLGRNDLSRVCAPGTVEVGRLMGVDRFSHVMHLVSELRGRTAGGVDAVGALRSLFPAGTVSGAPKVRAMEIIDGLEGSRRGFYGGAAGYFDCSGGMDFCISIRTMLAYRGTLHLRAGAGIVAGSDPALESAEVAQKLAALHAAIRGAGELDR